jgi:CheY-like chemotaxis protein
MPRRILVVDDDRAVLKMLTFALDDFGFETLATSSAENAIRFLSAEKPDAVVCDVVLPGMSGPEFVQRMRCLPEVEATPVVLISAIEEPVGHRADSFMRKPLNPFKLADNIRDMCEGRRKRRPAVMLPSCRP